MESPNCLSIHFDQHWCLFSKFAAKMSVYFHGVLINACNFLVAFMQLCGSRLAVIYFRSRVSFLSDVYDFSTTRDIVSNRSIVANPTPTHQHKATKWPLTAVTVGINKFF